jgi:hypothetical protein
MGTVLIQRGQTQQGKCFLCSGCWVPFFWRITSVLTCCLLEGSSIFLRPSAGLRL